MKEKFFRFMQGRNGLDHFSRFLMYFGLLVMLVFYIIGLKIGSYIALIIILYGYYRVFSRNYAKRSAENRWYLGIKGRVMNVFRRKGGSNGYYHKPSSDPNHMIFKCPACRQKVRVPKGRGRIEISCPKCKKAFIKKT